MKSGTHIERSRQAVARQAAERAREHRRIDAAAVTVLIAAGHITQTEADLRAASRKAELQWHKAKMHLKAVALHLRKAGKL